MWGMSERISRRRFVTGSVHLTVVAPLIRSTPLIARQSRSRISDTDRRTLRAAADVIVPAHGRMPAASAVGAVGYIERVTNADQLVASLLLDGVRAVEARAEATQNTRFDLLTVDLQTAVLAHFETTNTPANFFTLLRDLVYEAYYTQPRVQKLIGYNFRSGRRRTAALASFDEQLVSRLRQQKPFYRQVP
jgi:hypothetical protein